MAIKSIFSFVLNIIGIAFLQFFIQLRIIPIMPDMNNSSLNAIVWFTLISVFTVVVMLYIFSNYETNWRTFLNPKTINWKTVFIGLLLVTFVSIIAGIQITIGHTPVVNQHSFTKLFGMTNTTKIILTTISMVVVGPFLEEVLFRGVIFSFIERYVSIDWLTIILTAAIFSLAHGWTDLQTFVSHFFVGLITGWIRCNQRNLLSSTLVHGLCNGILIIIDSTV
ncbi:CPBP family intramembrane metalloprotease [Periweissella cryptocerci]|uniref:CPBP family intramembrane metalloprotease n=1 Tax=Periweissella cryptocerci TaxID=2506420 RepID=A0A4P6YTQ8_9LACO|nr:type II CAAX endopeptidase family protein [Periweissella cryptocerci]QBO36148.1 CPBP family intramembrane metalloprotease [Periweissella cryptocerci]